VDAVLTIRVTDLNGTAGADEKVTITYDTRTGVTTITDRDDSISIPGDALITVGKTIEATRKVKR